MIFDIIMGGAGSAAVPWDISTASYSGKHKLIGGASSPAAIAFNNNGTRGYIAGQRNIYQFDMTTAYDVSTAQLPFKAAPINTNAGIALSADGTKLYVLDSTLNYVNQYNLLTAWDITTAPALASSTFTLAAGDIDGITGITFSQDGVYMFIVGNVNDRIARYTLSTPWSVSTAGSPSVKSILAQDTLAHDLYVSPSGSYIYMLGNTADTVFQYTMSTPFDITTLTYSGKSFSATTQESNAKGMTFSPDGSKMYVCGVINSTIFQYTLSTAWDVSTAYYASKSFDVYAEDHEPTGVAFSPDGLKMYACATGSADKVWQYTLSSAYDVSTAVYASKQVNISGQTSSARSVTFSPDGLKMVVIEDQSDKLYQYTLSVAWDVSTATYASKTYTATQVNTVTGLFIKPDGTAMYISSKGSPNTIYQYALSTPWDISTASYSSKSFAATAYGIALSSDGAKMVCGDLTNDIVRNYTLSTPWDITTAALAGSASISSVSGEITNLVFSDSGLIMVIIDSTNGTAFMYNL